MMNHCPECGTKLFVKNKFCSKCGFKLSESITKNKIDTVASDIKFGISNIQRELKESETLNKISSKSKTTIEETAKVVHYGGSKLFRLLGILGLVAIFVVIINPFITDNEFVIEASYKNNVKNKVFTNYASFIGEVFGAIILPIILVYIGFWKSKKIKDFIIFPLICALIVYLIKIFVE